MTNKYKVHILADPKIQLSPREVIDALSVALRTKISALEDKQLTPTGYKIDCSSKESQTV